MSDYSFLFTTNQVPYDQLLNSRLNRQKLRLDNSIEFYVHIPKVHMLPFADEIDANDALVLDRGEEDKDDRTLSDGEDLNPENTELNISTKWKRSDNTSDFLMNKKSPHMHSAAT